MDIGFDAGVEYVLASNDGAPVAVFLLIPLQGGDVEGHVAYSPSAWGHTVPLLRAFVAWLWRETPHARLLAPVPARNRLARKMVLAAGFAESEPDLFEIRKP